MSNENIHFYSLVYGMLIVISDTNNHYILKCGRTKLLLYKINYVQNSN